MALGNEIRCAMVAAGASGRASGGASNLNLERSRLEGLGALDTRFNTRGACLRQGPADMTIACGEYRRPFLSSLASSVGSLGKSMEKGRNWKQKSKKNLRESLKN